MKKIYESRLPLLKNSCRYLKTKDLVIWIQGKNILISDTQFSNSQTLYQHSENVLSFDVNSQETLIASGEEGVQSDIYVFSLVKVTHTIFFSFR